MKNHIYLFFFLVVFALQLKAQNNYYFVSFKDKDTSNFNKLIPEKYLSTKCIERRSKFNLPILTLDDLPVNEVYKNAISPYILGNLQSIKWLNGLVVLANENLIDSINKFSFVKNILLIGFEKLNNKNAKINLTDRINLLEQKFDKNEIVDSNFYYGKATEQNYFNNIQKLHDQNYKAQNMSIAVLDAGFNNLDKLPYFNKNNIKAAYNLTDEDEDVYSEYNDEHGLNVMSIMAGQTPYKYVGSAPLANYYLFKTENNNSEYPIEEYYWAKAAEIADSIGVDIITTSLGYTEFDDKQFNHKVKDLTGNKTTISKVANMAASKGILVIASAGNDGERIWEKLSAPADADSVLTIGSCNSDSKVSTFSSVGFTKKGNIKPNIISMGEDVAIINSKGKIISSNGTSFSAPIVAGAAACLMQAFPNKTPFQIKEAIILSSNKYFDANELAGNGSPDFNLAYQLLYNYTTDSIIQTKQLNKGNLYVYLNSTSNQKVKITLQSMEEKVVFKQKEKIILGRNQFALNKSFKLSKGLYILSIKTNNNVLVKKVIIN